MIENGKVISAANDACRAACSDSVAKNTAAGDDAAVGDCAVEACTARA